MSEENGEPGERMAEMISHLDVLDSCLESFWCMTHDGSDNRLLAEGAQQASRHIRSAIPTIGYFGMADLLTRIKKIPRSVMETENNNGDVFVPLKSVIAALKESSNDQ